MKVLHSADAFVNITENWIYPQVTGVPNVNSAVLCDHRVNADMFPFPKRHLFVGRAPWLWDLGIPRVIGEIATRFDRSNILAEAWACRWRPNVIHAHFGTRGWQTLGLKRRLGVPLVTSFYGYDAWLLPKRDSHWCDRYVELFATGDMFLVEGPAMRDRLVALGCPAQKIANQEIGVDTQVLRFTQKETANGLRVVLVGSFVEKKGLPDALHACAKTAKAGVGLTVTIIGDAPPNRPYGIEIKQQLKALANCEELSGRVHFTGFLSVEQARATMAEHNVFVCASRFSRDGDAEGGSPVVLTEAMALGLVCVGTRHCDIPQVIVDGETGYLCEEGDIVGIADALCAIKRDPQKAINLATEGRRRVEEKFNLKIQMQRLADRYWSLAKPK